MYDKNLSSRAISFSGPFVSKCSLLFLHHSVYVLYNCTYMYYSYTTCFSAVIFFSYFYPVFILCYRRHLNKMLLFRIARSFFFSNIFLFYPYIQFITMIWQQRNHLFRIKVSFSFQDIEYSQIASTIKIQYRVVLIDATCRQAIHRQQYKLFHMFLIYPRSKCQWY